MVKWSFWGNLNYRRTVINPIHLYIFFWLLKMTFGNDFWASKCLLQLARMASCDFLCTLFTPCTSHPSPNSSNGPDKREFYFVNCLFAVSAFFVWKWKKILCEDYFVDQHHIFLSHRLMLNHLICQQAIYTMASFNYFNQNPSGFCFLVQIKAFVI